MSIDRNIHGLIKHFTCGTCSAQVGYDIVYADYSVYRIDGLFPAVDGLAFAVLRCRNCGMLNMFTFNVEESDIINIDASILGYFLENNPQFITDNIIFADNANFPDTQLKLLGQYPNKCVSNNENLRAVFRDVMEASNCLAVNATCAATVMCGRAIEGLAKSLGIENPNGTLCSILNKLKAAGYIDDVIYDAMKEIKDWRNIGAHADVGVNRTYGDVSMLLSFTIQVIEYVTHNPKANIEENTQLLSVKRKS